MELGRRTNSPKSKKNNPKIKKSPKTQKTQNHMIGYPMEFAMEFGPMELADGVAI